LEATFGEIGPLRRCFVVTEKGEKICNGLGFVTYALETDAKTAITSLNGKKFHKNTMIIQFAKSRLRDVKDKKRN